MKSPSLKKLSALRKNVEKLDKNIIKLLSDRFLITTKIQSLKIENSISLTQKNRENRLLEQYNRISTLKKLPTGLIEKLFRTIFSYSKKRGRINGTSWKTLRHKKNR